MRPPHWAFDAGIPLPRLRTITHLWATAAVLGCLGTAALALDMPLARWVDRGACPSWIQQLCGLAEVFGHGLGVAMILLVIAVLDPWHRHTLPRIATAALGSGLAANVLKLLVARARPHHFDLDADALASFVGWFPLLRNTSWEQGFPSSHTATAAGLAIALTCLYPRGRRLFPALAALAGGQRVLAEAHFASDVVWGAAVGCVFAPLCLYGGRLARTFDRLEGWMIARGEVGDKARGPHRRPSSHAHTGAPPDDVTRAA